MPAFAKWLTTNNSFKTQPYPFDDTVLLDSLRRVLGTAWRKPTVLTQKWTQHDLVSTNNGENDFFHCGWTQSSISLLKKKHLLSQAS
jgi:hypothetical protein